MHNANVTGYELPNSNSLIKDVSAAYEDVMRSVVRQYLGRDALPEDAGCLSRIRKHDFGMTDGPDTEAIVTASGVKLGDVVTGFYWDEQNQRRMWRVQFIPEMG